MHDILIHTEGGICVLTLNRTDKKNALTRAMYARLADALDTAYDDLSVNAVLIQGNASVFCAGNDIDDFLNPPTDDETPPVWRFLRTLAYFSKPVIAAVCGPAVGIGTTMLLHCDLVYAGDNAIFSLPFVNLGLCPEAASSLLLPQRIGHVRAAEAFFLGEPFNADTALAWGLVNQVVPADEALAMALSQAQKIAAKPPGALMAAKHLMQFAQQTKVIAQIDEERAFFTHLLDRPAAQEILSAFVQKRAPDSKQG